MMSVSSVSAGVSTDAYAIPDEGEFQGIEDIDSDDVTVKTGVIAKTLLSSPEARKELVRTLNKASHIHSVWKSLNLPKEKCDDFSILIRLSLGKESNVPIEEALAKLTLTLHDELQSLKNALEPSDSGENQKIEGLIQEMTLCIQHIKNNVNKLGIPKETFLLLIDLWRSMSESCDLLRVDKSNSGEESGSFKQHQGTCKPLSSLLPAVARLKAIKGDMQDSARYIAEILEKLADAETVKEAIAILNEYGGPAAILKNVKTLGIKQPLGVIFTLLLFVNDLPFPEAENWNDFYLISCASKLSRKVARIAKEIEIDPYRRIPEDFLRKDVIIKKLWEALFVLTLVSVPIMLSTVSDLLKSEMTQVEINEIVRHLIGTALIYVFIHFTHGTVTDFLFP